MNQEEYLTPFQFDFIRILQQKDQSRLLHKTSSIYQPNIQKPQQSFDLLFNLHPHQQLQEAKNKLQEIRSQFQKHLQLQKYLSEYQHTFKRLKQSKSQLQDLIKIVQGDSGHILERQNKMVGLSLQIQQILNHYNYISKFKFDNVIESYNDASNLQLTLSQLTEGIQFFLSHPQFSNSKKYLQKYKQEKKKTLGYVKGYLLKLFTKQNNYLTKYSKSINLQNYFIHNCYPKSTYKFLLDYITIFPQFKKQLLDLYLSAKQTQENIPVASVKKEQEIEEFLMDNAIKSLVRYIQINEPQIHNETLITFFSFYRTSIHENLILQYVPSKEIFQNITQMLQFLIYIIPTQMTYICYCLSLNSINNFDTAKQIVSKIVTLYSQLIKPSLKQLKNWKDITKTFSNLIELKQSIPQIIDNYSSKIQYKIYPLGKVINLAPVKTQTIVQLIQNVFRQIFDYLEQSLEFYLPKDYTIYKIVCPEPKIQQFIDIIPNLKQCPKLCSKYVIQSIDAILRSISNISVQLQTRYETFLWNITSIYGMQIALSEAHLSKPLLKTQMSLNLGSTVSVLNNVGKIQNKGNIWNYAKEVFSLLYTGLPVLNELTVDFNEYLKSHVQKLQSQFIKDLTFIYGKSMIQFLQKLHNHQQVQSQTLLSQDSLKLQYQRLILGMDEFVSQSIKQFQLYKKGYMVQNVQYGPRLITILMQQVLENLLELLSDFYIATSKAVNVEMVKELQFKDIKFIKEQVTKKLSNR